MSVTFQPAPDPVVSTTENGVIARLVSCGAPLSVTGAKSLMPGWPGGPKSSVPPSGRRRAEEARADERERAKDRQASPHGNRSDLIAPEDSACL